MPFYLNGLCYIQENVFAANYFSGNKKQQAIRLAAFCLLKSALSKYNTHCCHLPSMRKVRQAQCWHVDERDIS